MGERELREKYGGKLAKAINRAIRAEVPGGNEALDKLTQLAGPAMHSRWTDRRGKETPEAAAYFQHQRQVVDPMDATVRRTWGVPPATTRKKKPTSRKKQAAGKAPAAGKKPAARKRGNG